MSSTVMPLIIHFGQLAGGTAFTRQCCIEEQKPYLVIDASTADHDGLVQRILNFILENRIQILNVAGPRASKEPTAQEMTRVVINMVLQEC